ncbi:MAG: prolyl oligopeptidase family serine peptidase [Pseudomonadota bacterium]
MRVVFRDWLEESMRVFRAFIGLAALVGVFFSVGQMQAISEEVVLEQPTLEDFLGRLDFYRPELSPNGEYVSGIRTLDDRTLLLVTALGETDEKPRLIPIDDTRLNWVEWANDDRILLSITVWVDYRNGKRLTFDDFDDLSRRVVPVPVTRVLAMDRDGSNAVFMFEDDRKMSRNFYLGGVVSFLPGQPDHIMMSARKGGDLDLFKANIQTGETERVAIGTDRTYRWYVDRNGEPAFRYNTNRRGTVIIIYAREDRENGKIKWRKTKTIRLKDNEQNESATEFRPLYPGPEATTYYVAARPEGEDRTGIYLYDFEKDEYVETIETHDRVDIQSVLWNRSTRELQGIAYYDDRFVLKMYDPDIQAHLNGLDVFFEKSVNIRPIGSSRDGKTWLLYTEGPSDPGSYYTYNTDEAFVKPMGLQKIGLMGKALGQTEVVSYTARDGLELSGYLTRPQLWKEGDPLPPLIMMPHGGPEARDVIEFNYDVQVLVAAGYQVFQPNFRGSSGFGLAFADKGRRQWGKAMQTDVEDALMHLEAQGYVAEDNTCIMGASYGGYSALVAATLTPELYECVIASSGPSDLLNFLKTERKEEGRKSEAYRYWVEHIGDPREDKDAIAAVSPINFADRIVRPLLLIHPRDDRVVLYEETERMAEALDKVGVPYTLLTLEDSGHSWRSDEDERKEYETVLAFLTEHLPVREAQDTEDGAPNTVAVPSP